MHTVDMDDRELGFDDIDMSDGGHQLSEDDTAGRLMIVTGSQSPSRKRLRVRNVACLLTVVGVVALVLISVGLLGVLLGMKRHQPGDGLPSDPYERAVALLSEYPLIDGYKAT